MLNVREKDFKEDQGIDERTQLNIWIKVTDVYLRSWNDKTQDGDFKEALSLNV